MRERPFATPPVAKAIVAGIVSGAVASLVMNQFQRSWTKQKHGFEKPHGAQALQTGPAAQAAHQAPGNEDENSTKRVADFVYQSLTEGSLSKEDKRKFGTLVHYCFGMAAGAIYGGTVKHSSNSRLRGVVYGGLIWLLVDEGLIPLMGFSKNPQEYPLSTHAYALSSHLVYGFTLEAVRQGVREFLS